MLQDRGKLPRQVHRIADSGVHSLSTDWTMDVRGIAEQEGASVAETISDAMVHAIGRKPVHLRDLEFEVLDGFALDVVEPELAVFSLGQIVNGSDQTPVSISS